MGEIEKQTGLPDWLKEPVHNEQASPAPQPKTGWLQETIQSDFDIAQRLNLVEEIERLCAEKKTAVEIANELRGRVDPRADVKQIVRSVRSKLGIPSLEESDFAEWLEGYRKRTAS